MKKLQEKAIELIDKIDNGIYQEFMSSDLKQACKKVIEILAKENIGGTEIERINVLEKFYNLFIQRVKTGLTFDEAPSNVSDTLHYLKKLDEKTINKQNQFDLNQNHLIIGDNYYALQNLISAGLTGKVDVIYIDPPYNTQELQSYKDKFKRTGWLSMMKERLELAKILLSDAGVIFVSIDDNEQAYLKVLMDEIFGEDNFCNTLIWEKNYSPKSNNKKFSVNHDYIVLYFNDSNNFLNLYKKINPLPKTQSQLSKYKYNDNDGRGIWRSGDLTIYGDKNNFAL